PAHTGTRTENAENNSDPTAIAAGSATREGGVKAVTTTTAGVPQGDINITKLPGVQSESTIAVNPANHQNIIVGTNNKPGLAGTPSEDSIWVSTDGGTTWTQKTIPLPANALGASGDPSIVFSRDGNKVVYVHTVEKLVGGHAIVSAVSTDGGNTWTSGNAIEGNLDADGDGDHDDDDDTRAFVAVGPNVLNTSQDLYAVTFQRRGVIYVAASTDGINWDK